MLNMVHATKCQNHYSFPAVFMLSLHLKTHSILCTYLELLTIISEAAMLMNTRPTNPGAHQDGEEGRRPKNEK